MISIESIAEYFSQIPSLHRTLIISAGILFFWTLEGIIPSVLFNYKKVKHAGINLFFTLTTLIINLGFATLIVLSSDFVSQNGYGLIHLIDIPLWLQLVLALLVMDFIGAYLIHWIQHKIPVLWKFHMVHHSDKEVDTTTALRHHPGESIFRALFTILAVWISGAPIWMVMIYQSMSALLSQFNHANISLPGWVDKTLRWIIVTPAMHRIHHHHTRPVTDTNYGNIFPFWDKLFGTYHTMDTKDLIFGLDVYEGDSQSLKDLLSVPFKRNQKNPNLKS